MTGLLLAALAVCIPLLSGCQGGEGTWDFDGDNFLDTNECGPTDPTIHPGALDPYDDGIDQNCDGVDGLDADGDGYPGNSELLGESFHDCNDANPDVHPGAEEIVNDGLDNDCLDGDSLDSDGDGFPEGAADCDDADPTVYAGAEEQPDGVDDDCDGAVDEGTAGVDDDGDGACEGFEYAAGVPSCFDFAQPGDCHDGDPALHPFDEDGDGASPCGADGLLGTSDDDCDDDDASVVPGALETCNGRDDDCDGQVPAAEFDGDGDGVTGCAGDCADADPLAFPGAEETCNVVDDDCDGSVDEGFDADGDGFTPCAPTPDCDDLDPDVSPGAVEACDLVDNDCDGVQEDEQDDDGDGDPACSDCDDDPVTGAGVSSLDIDGDGYDSCVELIDCDEDDDEIYPGHADFVGGGIDDNCDGIDGVDADGDSSASTTSGGLDCDDDDPVVHGRDDDGDGWTLCGPDGAPGTGDEDCDDTDATLDLDDADGDGVTTCGGDCDDVSEVVYPNAAPLCDGLDNDCDGWADVAGDLSDFDGDGHFACADCDDSDAAIYPGAAELCDGLDGDCDGTIPANGPNGEFDNDGDGYAECAGDCNDFAPTLNPGEVDSCDGIDTDCDGVVDSDPDIDGDGWCAGDCDDEDPTRHPGLWEDPSDGLDLDCNGTDATGLQYLGAQLTGVEYGDGVGTSDWIPDFTGDGLPELAIGSQSADVTAIVSAGKVYIVTSEQLAGLPSFSLADAHAEIRGAEPSGNLGLTLLGVEDLDGDGLGDLLVSEHTYDTTDWYWGGAVHVFSGATLLAGGVLPRSAASVVILPEAEYDYMGSALAPLGDLDGDGLADFAIGASENSSVAMDAGSVYVVTAAELLAAGPTWDVGTAGTILRGLVIDGRFGDGLAGGFDLDLDGAQDLVVGATYVEDAEPGTGRVYGFLGGQLQAGGTLTSDDAWFTITRSWASLRLGQRLMPVGDLDGDGRLDLGVSMPFYAGPSVSNAGALLVFTAAQLAPGPALELETDDAWAFFTGAQLNPSISWGSFGTWATGADLDGDGLDDLAITEHSNDDAVEDIAGSWSGKIWIYNSTDITYGGTFTTDWASAALEGTASGDAAGYHPISAADVDGDGLLELAVPVPGDAEAAPGAGKVYVLAPDL